MTLDELRNSPRAAISAGELADLLELDPRTVRKALEDSELPGIKVGAQWRVPREPLLALLTAPRNSEAGPASPTVATADSDSGGPSREKCRPQLRTA